MPPSGCYFSRDNKNYRLSGLENNRSSGLPPDRGLHSLRLDTQAVAAPRCSLFPTLSFSLHLHESFRTLSLPVEDLFAVSVLPSPPSSLRSRQVPHSTPLRDPSRSFAPRCPPSQHLRGRLSGRSPASRLSFNLKSQLASNRYNRPSITTLHITHYKLTTLSDLSSLMLPLILFLTFSKDLSHVFRSRTRSMDLLNEKLKSF